MKIHGKLIKMFKKKLQIKKERERKQVITHKLKLFNLL